MNENGGEDPKQREADLSARDADKIKDSPPETLDDLFEEEKPARKSYVAIRDMIQNPDVAAELVKGKSIAELSEELGVNVNTIRKWMQKAPMPDLLHIESRRLLRHMSKRDLKKEKYLSLAASVNYLLDREDKIRNANVGTENRFISKTQIDQINILISGRGNTRSGEKDDSDDALLVGDSTKELLERIDSEGTGSTASDLGSGGED